jgi:hypothetical protein
MPTRIVSAIVMPFCELVSSEPTMPKWKPGETLTHSILLVRQQDVARY